MGGLTDLRPFPAKPQEGFAKKGRFNIRLDDYLSPSQLYLFEKTLPFQCSPVFTPT